MHLGFYICLAQILFFPMYRGFADVFAHLRHKCRFVIYGTLAK